MWCTHVDMRETSMWCTHVDMRETSMWCTHVDMRETSMWCTHVDMYMVGQQYTSQLIINALLGVCHSTIRQVVCML